jgi:hypothetical protein
MAISIVSFKMPILLYHYLNKNHQIFNTMAKVSVSKSIYIDIPVEELWKITALDFGNIAKWSAGVVESKANGESTHGAVCNERVCHPSYKGFKATTERFIDYNPTDYHFTYQIVQGLPNVVKYAENKWIHHSKGSGTELTMQVSMELKGIMGTLMQGVMKKNMGKILYQNLEELKVYAETGEQHERKKAVQDKYQQSLAKAY